MTWATNRERLRFNRRVIRVLYRNPHTGERAIWLVPLRCSPALIRDVDRAFARMSYKRVDESS